MNAQAQEVIPWNRNQGLGASDAAPACGKSKWCTPYTLWREKKGLLPPEDEAAIRLPLLMGTALEPLTLRLFSAKTGLATASHQHRVHDPRAPWRWVTLDALASDGRPVEAKSAAVAYAHEWGDEVEDDAVPLPYYLQCQHSMGCEDSWDYVWMPLIVLNREFRVYRVRRDNDVVQMVREHESVFMSYLRDNIAPPPIDLEDIGDLYPTDRLSTLEATVELQATIAELADVKAQRKQIDKREEDLVFEVKRAMGEYGIVRAGVKTLATCKQAKPSMKLNKEKLRIEHAQLYAQYEVETPGSRRLLIK